MRTGIETRTLAEHRHLRAIYSALVTVPLAVERMLDQAARAGAPERAVSAASELRRLNEEAYALREFLREPGLSLAALDQAEAALDALQDRMIKDALRVAAPDVDAIVNELLALDARGTERDALLRECEDFAGRLREPLRRDLALAIRAMRRGAATRGGLNVADAELPALQKMVSTLARELRDVERLAAVPIDELHRTCEALRASVASAPIRATGAERVSLVAERVRRDGPSYDDFVAARAIRLRVVHEDESLPRASPASKPRDPVEAPLRRVPFMPKSERPSPVAFEEDWRSVAGRKGEWLVYSKHAERWAALIERDPPRSAELLSRIVDSYWSTGTDRETRNAVHALLSKPSQEWIQSKLFEGLVWPASTLAGDRMGFDVFGLEHDASDFVCIEVKATDGTPETPFELTINEYRTATRERQRYVIARVSGLHARTSRISYWRDPARLVEEGRLALVPVRFQVAVSAGEAVGR